MSQRRIQDRVSKRSTRVISMFEGSSYANGMSRQRDEHAYVSDFKFIHNKPWLRNGKRKNQTTGFSSTIDSIFNIRIGGLNKMAHVSGGTLVAYDVTTG